jgi:hypothetical protein
LLILLASPPASAAVRLEVAGDARAEAEWLSVSVALTNRGDVAARTVEVEGELLGRRDHARLIDGLAGGATRAVTLRFPLDVPRPGVHALALHLRYVPVAEVEGAEPSSQRAYLLLALAAAAPPSVRMSVEPARVVYEGVARVQLESADGAAHRVRLRALAPRGLAALEPGEPVVVPPTGRVTAPLRVLRAGAPPGSRAGIVVLAAEMDGSLERTVAATGEVEVEPARRWLPRLREPALVIALALMAGAVAIELRRVGARPAA